MFNRISRLCVLLAGGMLAAGSIAADRSSIGYRLSMADLSLTEEQRILDALRLERDDPLPAPRAASAAELIRPLAPLAVDSVATRQVRLATAYDDALARTTDSQLASALRASRDSFDLANAQWHSGRTDMAAVITSLADAAQRLDAVRRSTTAQELSTQVAQNAIDIATGVVNVLERAAADTESLRATYEYSAAVSRAQVLLAHGDILGAVGAIEDSFVDEYDKFKPLGIVVFDMNLFVQNIRAAFDPLTVGYGAAVFRNGQLATVFHSGQARTSADEPELNQGWYKEMNIASISKTLTAVATLRLLDQNGIGINAPIANWLPSHWAQGPDVADGGLTFRDLLTHTSGLNGNDGSVAYDFATLETTIAQGVIAPQIFTYQNANFALLRVMIPRLAGDGGTMDLIDSVESVVGADTVGLAYAHLYIAYMRDQLFAPMGIDGDCKPTDTAPTLAYNPNVSVNGINAGDWTAICGSGGWYLSAQEVATFLAHARYNDAILSPAMRQTMNQDFLGWMDPANYNWGQGAFGTYHNHGGDLLWDGGQPANQRRGVDTCAMSFPNGVQVALLINSQGVGYPGHANSGYQCAALQAAFDDAWKPY